jgi:hypothetical protein
MSYRGSFRERCERRPTGGGEKENVGTARLANPLNSHLCSAGSFVSFDDTAAPVTVTPVSLCRHGSASLQAIP